MSVHSFKALCDVNTHTLVLGTMPGLASINATQYYAHKRNAFWPIMTALINQVPASYELPQQFNYQTRTKQLLSAGFGLWDVLAECEREGSLDSAIKSDSVVVNDFASLFDQNPQINTIAFNGKAAQKLFERFALPKLNEHSVGTESINKLSLPSSSPAMASLNLAQKYEIWRAALLPG